MRTKRGSEAVSGIFGSVLGFILAGARLLESLILIIYRFVSFTQKVYM
jgi:hypothetical protein